MAEALTRAEILKLPKEEQKAAFRANPGESVVHCDCQCPKCKRKFCWNGLLKDRHTLSCPYCPKEGQA